MWSWSPKNNSKYLVSTPLKPPKKKTKQTISHNAEINGIGLVLIIVGLILCFSLPIIGGLMVFFGFILISGD